MKYLPLAISISTALSFSFCAHGVSSNNYRFYAGKGIPQIEANSTGKASNDDPTKPSESPTILEMMPVNFNSEVTSALMATKYGDPVPMSSCLAYINAGLGQGNDGVYQITNNGYTYPVYCNQTSFGGGFTLVVSQFETYYVEWHGENGGNNGLTTLDEYDPSLTNKMAFALHNTQIPAHTNLGFSQQDYDGLSIPDYLIAEYHTGDINITGQNKDGTLFQVNRMYSGHYNYHDPDSGSILGTRGKNNTLTIDVVGQRGFNWAFSPGAPTVDEKGYSYGGNFMVVGEPSLGAWLIWVR